MRLAALTVLWSVALLCLLAALYAAWAAVTVTTVVFALLTILFAGLGWAVRLSTRQRLTALAWASGLLGVVFLVLGLAYGTATHLGIALALGLVAGVAFLGAKKTDVSGQAAQR